MQVLTGCKNGFFVAPLRAWRELQQSIIFPAKFATTQRGMAAGVVAISVKKWQVAGGKRQKAERESRNTGKMPALLFAKHFVIFEPSR